MKKCVCSQDIDSVFDAADEVFKSARKVFKDSEEVFKTVSGSGCKSGEGCSCGGKETSRLVRLTWRNRARMVMLAFTRKRWLRI